MATAKSSKSSKKKSVETEDQLLSRLVHIADRAVVLDTETTGLFPGKGDRIVEIGLVEIIDRKLTGRCFHTFINPERDMPKEALAVHGLTASFLQDKPVFAQVYKAFLEFCKGAQIVIHNAPFDLRFINMELERVGVAPFEACAGEITDTLEIAKEVWHGKRNTLDALCERTSVNNANRILHGALLDAELLAEVFLQMGKGQNDLLLAGGATFEEIKKQSADKEMTATFCPDEIIVLKATEEELAEHTNYLGDLDKDIKSLSIWSKIERGLNPLENYSLDGKPNIKLAPPPPPEPKNEDEEDIAQPITDAPARKFADFKF